MDPLDTAELRIQGLEHEVTRLRRLLNERGMPSTLRHQTRNLLGLIRAIMRRSAETTSSIEDYTAHLEGRFDALLRVQSALIASADGGADFHTIIADELLAHLIRDGERATLRGPALLVRPGAAERLGLAIHELTVNAVKFGAMTVPDGHITVQWAFGHDDAGPLGLNWRETGLTGLSALPRRRGFGLDMLENMLGYQLGAKSVLVLSPGGLQVSLEIPLANIAA